MKKFIYFTNLLALCILFSAAVARAQTPSITAQPMNDTACVSDTAMFRVASNDTAASYIWEVYNGTTWDTLHDGGAYSGATNDTLRVVASAALSNSLYMAVAYNGSGAMHSDSALLTVIALPVAGVIAGPSNVCDIMGMITLSDTVTGGVWAISNTSATITSAGMVTGVRPGLDTVMYTVTKSCGSRHASRMATVSHIILVDSMLGHSTLAGPSSVCVSASISIVPSIAGGMWNTYNGDATVTSTGMVTGVAAGIDTIRYILLNSCNTDTSWKSITIEVPFTAGTVTGPMHVCVGSWVAFTSSTTNGHWVSSNSTVASADTTGYITGRSQGMAIISYTHSNSCGAVAATDTIIVDRNASIIVGADSVGVGSTIALSDSATGGRWETSDSLIARVDSMGIVMGMSVGIDAITYRVTNICGTSTISKIIYVGDAPLVADIIGMDTVCAHISSTYTDATPGGTWSVSDSFGTINSAGAYIGDSSGKRSVINYTFTNGFGSSFTSKTVYINYTPPQVSVGGPSGTLVIGNGYAVVDTPTGGTWVSLRPNHVIFISAHVFVPTRPNGLERTALVYTYTNACGTSTDTFWVDIPGNDLVEMLQKDVALFSVFPNPNSGTFVFNLISSYEETANVVITNMLGTKVKEIKIATNKAIETDLKEPPGIYFLEATTPHGKFTTKVTITD